VEDRGMPASLVRYHFVCGDHGSFGSAAITGWHRPAERKCPQCWVTAEIWVGPQASEGVAGLEPAEARGAG
jgi:hypothetical protein